MSDNWKTSDSSYYLLITNSRYKRANNWSCKSYELLQLQVVGKGICEALLLKGENMAKCTFVKLSSENSKHARKAIRRKKSNTKKILEDRDKRKREYEKWLRG